MCCSLHSLSIAAISSRDIIIARFYAKVARLTSGYNMHFVGGLPAESLGLLSKAFLFCTGGEYGDENPRPPFPRGDVKPSGLTGGLGLQALRAQREGRRVVPHRGNPEGLIPGSPEKNSGWHVTRTPKVFCLTFGIRVNHSDRFLSFYSSFEMPFFAVLFLCCRSPFYHFAAMPVAGFRRLTKWLSLHRIFQS